MWLWWRWIFADPAPSGYQRLAIWSGELQSLRQLLDRAAIQIEPNAPLKSTDCTCAHVRALGGRFLRELCRQAKRPQ
jgi:hypothetical protein